MSHPRDPRDMRTVHRYLWARYGAIWHAIAYGDHLALCGSPVELRFWRPPSKGTQAARSCPVCGEAYCAGIRDDGLFTGADIR